METYNFKINENGVWYKPDSKEKSKDKWTFISSPLYITAISRDHNNENHGRLLEFYDSDNKKHLFSMPMELLAGDNTELCKILLSMGLQINTSYKARQLLNMYIQTAKPEIKMRCINKTGWFESSYIFPDFTISSNKSNEKIIFQGNYRPNNCYEIKGSLREWNENIARYCVDNSRLSLAICTAFAAPLLTILGEESGCVNFKGLVAPEKLQL